MNRSPTKFDLTSSSENDTLDSESTNTDESSDTNYKLKLSEIIDEYKKSKSDDVVTQQYWKYINRIEDNKEKVLRDAKRSNYWAGIVKGFSNLTDASVLGSIIFVENKTILIIIEVINWIMTLLPLFPPFMFDKKTEFRRAMANELQRLAQGSIYYAGKLKRENKDITIENVTYVKLELDKIMQKISKGYTRINEPEKIT